MSAHSPSKRILIVDDDAPTREGLAMVMASAGHAVRTAANGLTALREVRAARPDLILLDLAMPTVDGWTFRTQQLADPALADIPVVALGGADEPLGHEAELFGVSAWVARPSGAHEMLDLMGRLFDVLERERIA